MTNNDVLFKKLIYKLTGFSEVTYQNKSNFKKCQSFLKQYHPLEVNPNYVEKELEDLCFKLNVHSLDFKASSLKKLYKRLIETVEDSSFNEDIVQLMYGVILFLLDLSGPLVNNYDYQEIVKTDEVLMKEININWGDILTKSEDVLVLTRLNYESDDSYSSDYSCSEYDKFENVEVKNVDLINKTELEQYNLIKSQTWNGGDLFENCLLNLQSEYWRDSFDTRPLSRNLQSKSFLKYEFESYIKSVNPDYYLTESKNRIELSEYQLVRECIDVLLGASSSFAFCIESDPNIITKNRVNIAKSVKLINLSWKAVDNILTQLTGLATDCLGIRVVCTYILRNNIPTSFPAPIVAFGTCLHKYLNEFGMVINKLEISSRNSIGLTLFELLNTLVPIWTIRMKYLIGIVVCGTANHLSVLSCSATSISILNLTQKMYDETGFVDIDPWIVNCTLDLYSNVFQPYLYSLNALLSGQIQLDTDMFLKSRNSQFQRADINGYWMNNFSLLKNISADPGNPKILHDVPVLLHPWITELVSTTKAIDLLRQLSIELTRPTILNPILSEPIKVFDLKISSYENHFKCICLHDYHVPSNFILPIQNNIFNLISDNIIINLSRTHKVELPTNENNNNHSNLNLQQICRQSHANLIENILNRYFTINAHLISVFINDLQLRRSLQALKSVYFFQAGIEMHEFCEQIFQLLLQFSYEFSELALDSNLKLGNVLAESSIPELRKEAKRFSISVTTETRFESESINTTKYILLPCFTINYQVKWNLALIITPQIVSLANKCFQFLLHLKFAKYCLEKKLHLDRNDRNKWNVLSNRMCSLKLKLLQIISNFHAYVMNTFIVPSCDLLQKTIDEPQNVEDFTDFIYIITNPFQIMARGCLQTSEMSTIEKAVMKVVLLGIEASQMEVTSNHTVVQNLEEKYKRLIVFISAMFKSLSHLGISIIELDMSAFN